MIYDVIYDLIRNNMMYLLIAIGLRPGGSRTVHIYTQTIHRTTQITTEQQKTTNLKECGQCHVFASFTLAFAFQHRKKHEETSVRVRRTSVTVQYTYYQNTNTLQNLHTHARTHTHTHTHTHTLQNNIKPPQRKLKQTQYKI
jgi:hypothetical protein